MHYSLLMHYNVAQMLMVYSIRTPGTESNTVLAALILRLLGERAVLKAQTLRVVGVLALQTPEYKQYPQYKHPKYL